jgi:hypothetical protein
MPPIWNVGSVSANCAVDGIPGRPSVEAAGPASVAAERCTDRLVSPILSSLSQRGEITR